MTDALFLKQFQSIIVNAFRKKIFSPQMQNRQNRNLHIYKLFKCLKGQNKKFLRILEKVLARRNFILINFNELTK